MIKNYRNFLKTLDAYGPIQFNSPWAAKPSDEVMFNKTLESVWDTVKDDFKFRTLYVTLVIVTPGEELSQETKVTAICTIWESDVETPSEQPSAGASAAGDNVTTLPIPEGQVRNCIQSR